MIRSLSPWVIFLTITILSLSPLAYLIYKAASLSLEEIEMFVWRWATLRRALNSVGLVISVLLCSWLIAAPLALSMIALSKRAQRWMTICVLLPLTIPGYVLAYSFTAMSGPYGPTAQLFGYMLPSIRGFWGATLALTLYNFPYLFLTLSAGLKRVGSSRFEVARTLGLNPYVALWRAVLPSMRASSLAGSLMIGLYVLGDFGVASLMRVDTLSYSIFVNWSQPSYAAWLALLLCLQAAIALGFVWWLERGDRRGGGERESDLPWISSRAPWVTYMGMGLAIIMSTFGFVLPLFTTIFWVRADVWSRVAELLWTSWISAMHLSLIATLINVSVALWFALWVRSSQHVTDRTQRLMIARIGYALPPLSIALGFVFMSLSIAPELRGGHTLLFAAYLIHSLLLAIGPIQGALEQWSPQWIEAARSLGASRWRAFWEITLPTLRAGVGLSIALTAIAMMKELPLTKLLSPIGTRTLALEAWSFADEGLYDHAAPFALCLIIASSVTALFTLNRAWRVLR